MQERNYKILTREAKILEYWRKRYLAQAAAVAVAAMAGMALARMYVPAVLLQLLFCLCIITVAYLMVRELRESLQTRGENLIFGNGGQLFGGIRFDYGQGLSKDDKLWDTWVFQARECRGVMAGKGFLLEEDWLYNMAAAKFFVLKMTVFEGIVLAVSCPAGKAATLCDRQEVRAAGEKMRRLLGAEKMRVVSADDKIVFCFQTKKKLFYQFGLLRPNTVGAFVRRVDTVRAAAEEIFALAHR